MNEVQKRQQALKKIKGEKANDYFSEYITQVILNFACLFYTEESVRKDGGHLIKSKVFQQMQKKYIDKLIELELRHFDAFDEIFGKGDNNLVDRLIEIYNKSGRFLAVANTELLEVITSIGDEQYSRVFVNELQEVINKHKTK